MEEIYVHIGSFGLYQMLVFFALLPFGLYSGLDIASQNVLYGEPTHWCRVPYLQNLTAKEQRDLAIPVDEETGQPAECVYYDAVITNWTTNQAVISECESWFYTEDVFLRTAVTEVCFAISIFFIFISIASQPVVLFNSF